MLFILIKNELIKIFSKAKTWIVFGLFVMFLAGMSVINYKSSKSQEYFHSPEGQIENLTMQKEYNNNRIEYLKDSTESWAQDEIVSLKSDNEYIDKDIEEQKKLIESKDDEVWKKSLIKEKEDLQSYMDNNPQNSNEYYKERIDEINSYLDNNEEPIETWKFDGVNFATGIIQILGATILVAGIAVFMSDIVSGESTPPTLKFLLVQPITRGKVILSKFISVVITVVGLIVGAEVAVTGIVGAIAGFSAKSMPIKLGVKYMWDYSNLNSLGMPILSKVDGSGFMSTRGQALLYGLAFQILFIIACCAFIFMISAIFKSSMITMALSVIISVASTSISMISDSARKAAHLLFLNYGSTIDVITGDIVSMYENPNFTLNLGIILMCITIVISYSLAHIIFSKKDILV